MPHRLREGFKIVLDHVNEDETQLTFGASIEDEKMHSSILVSIEGKMKVIFFF